MKSPDMPENEFRRQAALCDLCILDTPPEARFDRLTRIAKKHFKVSIALISLIDNQRQWFKSRQGLQATETPREISFCGHAILSDDVFYIANALNDPRFADNPLVTGPPNIRFYAGAPLHAPNGERIGTLCIIDDRPHDLSADELSVLRDLADSVESELAQSRLLDAGDELARFKNVLDSTLDMIFMFDAETLQFVYLNKGAVESMGYSQEELLRLHPYDIKPLIDKPDFIKVISPLLEGKQDALNFETLHQHKDGTDFPVEIFLQLVREDDNSGRFIAIVRDVSARTHAENTLRDSESRIRAIVDTVVDGIITINAHGIVQTLNPAAEHMFGYATDEVVGRNVKMLMPEPYSREHDGYLDHYLNTGDAQVIGIGREVEGRRKDGSTFPMDLAVSQMEMHGEVMFTGIVRDITERKRVDKLKSQFVSTVSHELRTPLTSISGALGLVLGGAVGEIPNEAKSMLQMASRNSERLTLLINDILDLEKIESGSMSFDLRSVDLVSVVGQALDANQGYADKHGVKLKFSRKQDTSVTTAMVWADSHRLLQVLANLLSNAIKFSPRQSSVEVFVAAHENRFRVSIQDHGPGIPQAFHSRIFQRFSQADSSDTREKGGTGLGLSISKAIIEQHDGIIGFESDEGQGCVFYFDLPEYSLMVESADNQSPAVLICEDNTDAARVLAAMLEQEGLSSDIAHTVASAKELLARKSYRMLLLDLSMPDQSGLSFIQQLKAEESTRHLPIIVVSGNADEGRNEFTGDAISVVDWIQKPVDKARLLNALQQALVKNERARILHIEDAVDVRMIVKAIVSEMADYQSAATLQGARNRLGSEAFDLLIVDLSLPDGSGLDLIHELNGRYPVIVFSGANVDEQFKQQISAVLTKSSTSNEQLLTTVKRVINQIVME